MTADIVAFIHARLDEDEGAARAALWSSDPEAWSCHSRKGRLGTEWCVVDSYDEAVIWTVGAQAADDEAIARHVVQQQPKRALRGVEAKRRIVKLAEVEREARNTDPGETMFMNFVLKQLASEWSDHRDHQPEWKP